MTLISNKKRKRTLQVHCGNFSHDFYPQPAEFPGADPGGGPGARAPP